MKHIKGFNESLSERVLSGDELTTYFDSIIDISISYTNDKVYFNEEDFSDYNYNDFSGRSVGCVPGIQIEFGHKYYDICTPDEFNKYVKWINEFKSDLDRFISGYKPEFYTINLMQHGIQLIIKP